MKRKQLAAWVCTVVLLLSVIGSTAGAEGGPNIVLGTSKIVKGNYIWFGGKDVQTPLDYFWRILDTESTQALLIYRKKLGDVNFRNADTGNAWAGSLAEAWCNNLYNTWPFPVEKAAIKTTSITESGNYNLSGLSFKPTSISNAHFYFLSAQEAQELFTSSNDRTIGTEFWWTRSGDANDIQKVGRVSHTGDIVTYYAYSKVAARPAFHLNTSSVLFMSGATGGKPSGIVNELAKIEAGTIKEWKLTLKDASRSLTVPGTSLMAEPGDTIHIPYSGAKYEGMEYISVLVCKGGSALYYGSVHADPGEAVASFVLPNDIPKSDYTLKVYNEQKNPDEMSDYANAPIDIPLKVTDLDWGTVAYTWADDYSTVTAKHTSRTFPDYSEEETVSASGVVTSEPTTTHSGLMTYTSAAFANPAFEKQVKQVEIPQLIPHILTINYLKADGTPVAQSHVEKLTENTPYAVASPFIEGLTADQITVSGTMGAANITVIVTYASKTDAPPVGLTNTYTDPDGNTYQINSDGTAIFLTPNASAGTVNIPAAITVGEKQFKVTEIAAKAFYNNKKLKKITIGNSIITIGKSAFEKCTGLKTVKGGSGLVTIADNAFKGCSALTAFTLDKNVSKIGKSAFDSCTKLKKVTIKTAKLKKNAFGKNCFNNIAGNAVFKCPKKKLKDYTTWLKKPGRAPASSKIK